MCAVLSCNVICGLVADYGAGGHRNLDYVLGGFIMKSRLILCSSLVLMGAISTEAMDWGKIMQSIQPIQSSQFVSTQSVKPVAPTPENQQMTNSTILQSEENENENEHESENKNEIIEDYEKDSVIQDNVSSQVSSELQLYIEEEEEEAELLDESNHLPANLANENSEYAQANGNNDSNNEDEDNNSSDDVTVGTQNFSNDSFATRSTVSNVSPKFRITVDAQNQSVDSKLTINEMDVHKLSKKSKKQESEDRLKGPYAEDKNTNRKKSSKKAFGTKAKSFAKWALLTAEYSPWCLAKKSVSFTKWSLLDAKYAPWPLAKKSFEYSRDQIEMFMDYVHPESDSSEIESEELEKHHNFAAQAETDPESKNYAIKTLDLLSRSEANVANTARLLNISLGEDEVNDYDQDSDHGANEQEENNDNNNDNDARLEMRNNGVQTINPYAFIVRRMLNLEQSLQSVNSALENTSGGEEQLKFSLEAQANINDDENSQQTEFLGTNEEEGEEEEIQESVKQFDEEEASINSDKDESVHADNNDDDQKFAEEESVYNGSMDDDQKSKNGSEEEEEEEEEKPQKPKSPKYTTHSSNKSNADNSKLANSTSKNKKSSNDKEKDDVKNEKSIESPQSHLQDKSQQEELNDSNSEKKIKQKKKLNDTKLASSNKKDNLKEKEDGEPSSASTIDDEEDIVRDSQSQRNKTQKSSKKYHRRSESKKSDDDQEKLDGSNRKQEARQRKKSDRSVELVESDDETKQNSKSNADE